MREVGWRSGEVREIGEGKGPFFKRGPSPSPNPTPIPLKLSTGGEAARRFSREGMGDVPLETGLFGHKKTMSWNGEPFQLIVL